MRRCISPQKAIPPTSSLISRIHFALAQAELYDVADAPYTDEDLNQWDQQCNEFYEISKPAPETAGVEVVPATREDLEAALPEGGEPVGGYAEEADTLGSL